MEGAMLIGTKMKEANMEKTSFVLANLAGADLQNAYMVKRTLKMQT
jgi:uncharacterized protein YjbI with pentapeptide repeats